MKARRVRKLEPDGTVHANAARIVATRLKELYAFDPAIRDPSNVTDLHDMRIAAKRLRYVLEVVGFAFGPAAAELEAEAKWLQEVLGEIHDCDVLSELVERHVTTLRDVDRSHLIANGPEALARLPNRTRYAGLEALDAFTQARRFHLYEDFLDHWDRLQASGFRARVEAALA
jgi:CHAD domain-containing protein